MPIVSNNSLTRHSLNARVFSYPHEACKLDKIDSPILQNILIIMAAQIDLLADIIVDTEVRPSRQTYFNNRIASYKRSLAARRATLLKVTSTPVSKSYLLTVKCVRDHSFTILQKNLARNIWCPDCRAIEDELEKIAMLANIAEHAKSQGGECLSEQYLTARSPLKWRCGHGHEWKATWDNVLNKKSWCPTCARSPRQCDPAQREDRN